MQTPKIIDIDILIKNGPEIKIFVAHQMQTVLMQGDVQPPKIIYLYI